MKQIEWEQRAWELYSKFVAEETPEVAMKKAQDCIIYYQSQMIKPEAKKEPKVPVNNIEERIAAFREECNKFASYYGRPMIENFFGYWSEPNKSNTKMKWELQKTWEIERRLRTWADRSGIRPIEEKKPVDRGEEYKDFIKHYRK